MPAQAMAARRGRRLTIAGLIAVTLATLLMMAWAIFPSAPAEAAELCPGENPNAPPLPAGYTLLTKVNAVGDNLDDVVLPAGTIFCVKAGNDTTGIIVADGTTTLVDYINNGHSVSHYVTYSFSGTTTSSTTATTTQTTTTQTTTTPPGGTTTTPPGTTTTTDTPTVSPTTVTPSETTDVPTVNPTTVQPNGTAFTGPEDVVPIGILALSLLTAGSGLLWAGARKRRHGVEDGS